MSTVVGLVKSRLRNKSRRGKSMDGVDVIFDDGGNLVRFRSLRQEALAEYTDDEQIWGPTRSRMPPRTPGGLDPADLADTLETDLRLGTAQDIPQIPPQPVESFPVRQSSLQNPRAYEIKAHQRTLSQKQDAGAAHNDPPRRDHRRHYTISSPSERPQYDQQADYFHQVPVRGSSTRTAKLFGSIAQQQRNSTEISTDHQVEQKHAGRPSYSARQSLEAADIVAAHEDQALPPQNIHVLSRLPKPPSGDVKMSVRDTATAQSPAHRDFVRPKQSDVAPFDSRMPVEDTATAPAPLRLKRKTAKHNLPEHVRLPSEIQLGHSERTYTDTTWHPAVEQEVIERQRTEILHPMIERDIHVHHYYEYEQPVNVTEVLPPKHYQVDQATGRKIEIQPPSYWQIPTSMSPVAADISDVKRTERHYVVNEQHPQGKLEDYQETSWI